jgi:hypothetical protein
MVFLVPVGYQASVSTTHSIFKLIKELNTHPKHSYAGFSSHFEKVKHVKGFRPGPDLAGVQGSNPIPRICY